MSAPSWRGYDKSPYVNVPGTISADCAAGWPEISERLRVAVAKRNATATIVAVECYPGVADDLVRTALAAVLRPVRVLDAKAAFRSAAAIDALVAPDLGGDDPIFGRLTRLELSEFLDEAATASLRAQFATAGVTLVVGPAAFLIAPDAHVRVFADLPRWEAQLRQRRGEADNLGVRNRGLKASLAYKRAFFVDWRVCDRLKARTMANWDFLLDTTVATAPKLVSGAIHLAGLHAAAHRPFRVVPFFDPGPWGGQWMKEVCDLDRSSPNYAWCFDCVPEENSLLLGCGDHRIEIPAMNLVLREPRALLGEPVHSRFGAEFPIRFDFLDTMGGGNLSFQVHPTAKYAREHFGLSYTQDESYYILEANPGATVFLGHKPGADFDAMMADLAAAQHGTKAFDDERFAARFPARKHDHFLIPAGTLHCSGKGSMVLEISATPFIFTFKLWDWGRLGLDGKPRPINLERGRAVIDWSRDEAFARRELVNQITEIARGPDWREERTGLHRLEFIETRRHWFSGPVPHDTGGMAHGSVNVLNLVEGNEAIVESPDGKFAPFLVHYAETFIVPAACGPYTIRPSGRSAATGTQSATLKAFVRSEPPSADSGA